MTTFDAFLGKFSGGVRQDLSNIFGVLWDSDSDVSQCRSCGKVFSLFTRRHHCRACGGIYCKSCVRENIEIDDYIYKLACISCTEENSPGEAIRKLAIERIGNNQNMPHPLTESISLTAGSSFGIERKGTVESPKYGYFEIFNKSMSPIAIKVMKSGCDSVWEVSKPLYYLIHPKSVISGWISNQIESIDIILLWNYPITYSNTSDKSKPYKVTPFRDFVIYRGICKNKNVLLKHKGDGALELRQGGMIGNRLLDFTKDSDQDSGASPEVIDFTSNIIMLEKVASSTI